MMTKLMWTRVVLIMFFIGRLGLSQDEAALDRDEFIKQLPDHYIDDKPEEVTEVWIENVTDRDFYLNNLKHLPNLTKIEFDSLEISIEDLKKVSQFSNIVSLEFSDYEAFDFKILAAAKSLVELEFTRCRAIEWDRFEDARPTKLRRLKLYETNLTADDLLKIAKYSIEEIELSSIDISDDALGILTKFDKLKSVTTYNCTGVEGQFLTELKSLEEFKFTGELSNEVAMKLATFEDLKNVELNIQDNLDAAWYEAIADRCKNLKRLFLPHQGLVREKCDHISKMTQLEALEIFTGSYMRDLGGRQASYSQDPGVFRNLSGLKNLKTLRLSGKYRFGPEDGKALTSLTKLEELELRNITFVPGAFERLEGLEKLRTLDFFQCKGLSEKDSQQLGKLVNLESLVLGLTILQADFSTLGNLKKLRELDLTGCRFFNDDDMQFARGTTNLEELTINFNYGITDKGLAELKHTKKLKDLTITKATINGKAFTEWPADHPIESIYISGVSVTNSAVNALSKFKQLKVLEVRVIKFGQTKIDISCFIDSKSLEYVAFKGSYITDKEAFDKLTKARPELAVLCNFNEP